MKCRNPYMRGSIPHGCGRCIPCRIDRRNIIVTRCKLENMMHSSSSFVTLTYSDEYLPSDGSLVPDEVSSFMRRLRDYLRNNGLPNKLRYVGVGEYGDKSQRPHYHLLLFGFGCLGKVFKPREGQRCFCSHCQIIEKVWGKGHVLLGEITDASSAYVAGYVVKGMMNSKNTVVSEYLKGRYPEYARYSNRPGIGAVALDALTDFMFSDYGYDYFIEHGDVPKSVTIGGKSVPLGRYLRNKLRDYIGMDEATRKLNVERFYNEMQAVFKDALSSEKNSHKSAKQIHMEKGQTRAASMIARSKIHKQEKEL